jgi:hypothetical protein
MLSVPVSLDFVCLLVNMVVVLACLQLLREGKWTFNSFLYNGLLEYLGTAQAQLKVSSSEHDSFLVCFFLSQLMSFPMSCRCE